MTKIATPAISFGRKEDKQPELLAPAGSFEKMAVAIHYGADAVYCGGKRFNLRAHATNFDEAQLQQVVDYAHPRGVKVYVAVNIFAHEEDFVGLDEYLLYLGEIEVDGLIISDPGILDRARRLVPEIPLHLSTQANVTNSVSARFWQDQGMRRLNLARELSLTEITSIKKALSVAANPAEIEVFVHGALCISYSGRCLLSCYLTGRDANRGECAHPCRYRYALVEEKRPGQYFPVEEDERGTYIFNSKDLCLLPHLPALLWAGVDSLKIEGRMKSPFYVGSVVRVYRAALDFLQQNYGRGEKNFRGGLPPAYMEELAKIGTRGETDNFITALPDAEDMIYDAPRLVQQYIPVGIIRNTIPASASCPHQQLEIEFRNPADQGEAMEFLDQDLSSLTFKIMEFRNQEGELVERARPGDRLQVVTMPHFDGWEVNGLIRKKMA
jgi:putative protease